jgi:hypothetical protein
MIYVFHVYYNKKIAFIMLYTRLLQCYMSIIDTIKISENMSFLPYLCDIYVDSDRNRNADCDHICYELLVNALFIVRDSSQRQGEYNM